MATDSIILDWERLGRELRISADDAHEGETPRIDIAWAFLAYNPECFGFEDWPEFMPVFPPIELIAAYYRIGEAL